MSMVNSDALNVLTKQQADEARRIIDEIGFVSNRVVDRDQAVSLNKVRGDLKHLFNSINDDRYPAIQ